MRNLCEIFGHVRNICEMYDHLRKNLFNNKYNMHYHSDNVQRTSVFSL